MIRRLALLCSLCGVAASAPALAQVHVDTGALNGLSAAPAPAAPDAPAKAAPARVKPVPRHRVRPPAVRHPAPKPADSAKQAAPPPPVAIAPAPPPVATLAPAPPPPPPHILPAPVIPMVSGAGGGVSAIEGGLRITFAPGKSDMSPATVEALHSLGQALAPNALADVNIYAYAAGAPDDPSTPRRLSLSRALAARAVLLSDDIASTRIYVHALGSTASPGPPDRVDVQLAGTPQAPHPAPAPATPAAPAAPRTP